MLHRFFHFLKQSLLVVLCILLLGAPAGTDGVVHGSHWVTAGRRLVLLSGQAAVPQCRQQLPSGFHVRHHLCPRELYFLRCAAADLY